MADTAQRIVRLEPPRRPERLIELDTMGTVGDAARPLSTAERLLQITGVRRLIVVVVLRVAVPVSSSVRRSVVVSKE